MFVSDVFFAETISHQRQDDLKADAERLRVRNSKFRPPQRRGEEDDRWMID